MSVTAGPSFQLNRNQSQQKKVLREKDRESPGGNKRLSCLRNRGRQRFATFAQEGSR